MTARAAATGDTATELDGPLVVIDTDRRLELDTYTGQQATAAYRTEFLRSLEDFDARCAG